MDTLRRAQLVEDLRHESAWFADLVPTDDWDRATPAPGWTIRDQVAHVARFDLVAAIAITDPDTFVADRDRDLRHTTNVADFYAAQDRALPVVELRKLLADNEALLLQALQEASWTVKIPWYGPPMSVASCATARLMEKFAHAQDVADALGVTRVSTPSLVHIADLGYRTIGFSYVNRGLPPPTDPIRVELVETSTGTMHAWGPKDAHNEVSGSLLDFCLVVTRRRGVHDTSLNIRGSVATAWSQIAQAFAGPPGNA